MNFTSSVLFIDQDKALVDDLISSLQDSFSNTFFHTENVTAVSGILKSNHIDIIFLDIGYDDNGTGLQIFKNLKEKDNKLIIAVVPEDNTYLTSKVIEFSPFFHISKPYDVTEVRIVLKRALEKVHHSQKVLPKKPPLENFCGIIGKSSAMASLFDLIIRVADDDFSTVLIRGESGTGKELVAKAIHSKSKRKSGNFVPVNCAAIPDDLLESELFGHTKGAFTGATQNKQGRIQYADGGTLFLDEIGDMKPALQAKLLRVLQEKEFEPVGGLQSFPVDTRVLAATHCDLEQMVSEGKFREDLYYRLSVIPLNIPPLRARREDIPLLIEAFINTYTTERNRERFDFSQSALQALLRYTWRGNVRELENLIQHMSILFTGKTIDVQDLPEKYLLPENQTNEDISFISQAMSNPLPEKNKEPSFPVFDDFYLPGQQMDFNEMINQFETQLIVSALRATGGNKKEAARLLKLKRTTLLEKIKKKGLTQDNW
jgi:DNA-binding NtrC family response regulator